LTRHDKIAVGGPGVTLTNVEPPLHAQPDLAADVIWALSRALWDGWTSESGWVAPVPRDTRQIDIAREGWIENANRFLAPHASAWQRQAVTASVDGLISARTPDTSLFSALRLGQDLVGSSMAAPDLKYHLLRSLRSHYRIVPLGARISKLYHLIAHLEDRSATDLELPLRYEPGQNPDDGLMLRDFLSFFEVLRPERKSKWATLDPGFVDLQSAPAQLFGLFTSIPGFDAMFGGSGLTLFDSIGTDAAAGAVEPAAGRIVLVNGPFGAGKSLLTHQFAIEVARKGGFVIIASMEQSMEESLFALRSIGIETHSGRFEIRPDIWDSFDVLRGQPLGKGALVFLRLPKSYGEGVKPVEGFTEAVSKRFDLMGAYGLRLLVIDPIDAALSSTPEDEFRNRKTIHKLFEEAKARQINLWITSEDNEGDRPSEPFVENIADTVIQLGADPKGNFFRRTVEVKKSRLQREEPGRHSLLITSGEGIHIYLASSARTWSVRRSKPAAGNPDPIDLGIAGVEQMLPRDSVRRGDLIVFHGPPNSARTSVGLQFLQKLDSTREQALLIADMDQARALALLDEAGSQRQGSHVRICSILPGWIEAGQILERIQNEIEELQRHDKLAIRILLTNLSQWEASMPLIGDDAAFGQSLLNLLRNSGATCIVTTAPAASGKVSALTELALAEADCQVEFDIWEIGNKLHSVTRVLRCHEGKHRRDRFEILMDDSGLRIEPGVAALHRKDPGGTIRSVLVRSSLHADTLAQERYDARVMGAIGTSLTGRTAIEEQITHYDPALFSMHRSSAVDELQIIQLDEFQLPPTNSSRAEGFHKLRFSALDGGPHPLSDRVKRFADRVLTRDKSGNITGCIALPYYENLSLLAYRKDVERFFPKSRLPSSNEAGGWDQLRDVCLEWQSGHPEPRVFFSCPIAHPQSIETYNCLFFEILLCGRPIPTAGCQLSEWLTPGPAKAAARIFRDLCYRSYRYSYRESILNERAEKRGGYALGGREDEIENSPAPPFARGPYVWRHWYNTLNAYLAALRPEDRNRIKVQPLFNNITTAGEWYLALPAYSAAPEVGWDLIRLLTSYGRELQRVYLGVGLPTRRSFYGLPDDTTSVAESKRGGVTMLSPFFDLDLPVLQDMVQHAFQRSRFFCYGTFTETISAHLKRILELPEPSAKARRDGLYKEVDRVIENLVRNLAFVRADSTCEQCREQSTC
jgi:KaiC/GvpD/RAD55 family RecA-like ATPase